MVVQNPYRRRHADAVEAVDDVAEEAVGPGAVRGVAQGDVRDPQVVTAQHLAKAEWKDHSNMRLFGAELCMGEPLADPAASLSARGGGGRQCRCCDSPLWRA